MNKTIKFEVGTRVAVLASVIALICILHQPLIEQARWKELGKLETGELQSIPVINSEEAQIPVNRIEETDDNQIYNESLINDWDVLTGREMLEIPEKTAIMTAEEFAEYMDYDMAIGSSTIKSMTREATEVNPDVVGWIYIPGTKINYPILYRKGEEEFYLNYNSKGKKSAAGAIFLDYTSKGKFADLTVIHGHSMKDKTMFGALLDYKDQVWADDHSRIYIYDGTYVKEYQIFSCFVINADTEDLVVGFNSRTARDLYYSRILQRSLLDSVGIANPSDVILLNTCSYEASNFRCLVYASCVLKNGR